MENKTFFLLLIIILLGFGLNVYYYQDEERRFKELYMPAIKELIHEIGHMQQNLRNGIYVDNDIQELQDPCFMYSDADVTTTLPPVQYSFTLGNEHNEKGRRCLLK